MLVDIGYFLLHGVVLLAAWGAGAFLVGGVLGRDGWVRSGERAVQLSTCALLTCAVAVIVAVYRDDFSVAYVTQVSERALPSLFKFTAFWAGMNGSMLMWLLFLAGYATLALFTLRRRGRELAPWVGLSLSLCILFFAAMVAFQTNPLKRLAFMPEDGRGMNPQLQNYWMAIHPPTLYLGYVGLAVPFAFAVAALVTGRLGMEWIRTARIWVLWPWLCLGIGMVFGGHWAYVELGWGGYWAWDPVENASFMPWLMASAFLHSVMVQERRGMFRAWNVTLIMAAFALSIFGTFITRSGVVESVHSFARSGIGPWFLGFVVAIVAASAGLIYYRWPTLSSTDRIDSLVSREFGFMLNNLLFVTICGVTLFLTMYAPISEWATGERWTVGASAFNEINGSLGVVLLVLTGVGPVIAWRRASARSLRRNFAAPVGAAGVVATALLLAGVRQALPILAWSGAAFVTWCIVAEFVRGSRVVAANRGVGPLAGLSLLVSRNRRRYGGYVVHLAVAMFFVGIAGMAFRQEAEASLLPGETISMHGYELTYAGPASHRTARSDVDAVRLSVRRSGKDLGELTPEFKVHHKFPEAEKDVAIHETSAGDLYAILASPLEQGTQRAKVQVLWNPLVRWVWMASYLMLAGTVLCAWPERRPRVAMAAATAEAA